MKKVLLFVVALAASVASAASSCETADLLHRWSFNGSLEDACGGNTAVLCAGAKWNDAEHPTGIVLPGGASGQSGYVDLGYDCGVDGNELTIEIWGRHDSVQTWSRIFDWGVNSMHWLTMCWTSVDTRGTDCVAAYVNNASYVNLGNTLGGFELGTQYHISMRMVQRANGGADLKWQKRDATTGAVLGEGAYGSDTYWPFSKFNEWQLWLGRSHNNNTDNDAGATYDEVRIWKKALTDEQLEWSVRLGPDTPPTPEGNATTSTISASTIGSGSVAIDGGSAVATVARNAAVTLVATPAAGSRFCRWSGDTRNIVAGAVTDATITFEAPRDSELVALFVTPGEPATATWTGGAGNGDPADAANWKCLNAAGEQLSGVVPTESTAVTIAGDTDFNCPAGATLNYASLTVGDCKLKGDCDWRGLGAFSIGGKIDLDGHTLSVPRLPGAGMIVSPFATDTTVAVPELVPNSASFWLDAADTATITRNEKGEVTAWTSKDANHVVASSAEAPRPPVDGTEFWGRPTVDFGAYSSECDLRYPRFTELRTLFWVIKIENSDANFLLGDWNNGNGVYNFHRGAGGVYGNPSYAKYDQVWNGTRTVNWGGEVVPDDDFQVIAATMKQNCCSDAISRDRTFTERSGGRQLSELICFNTVLSAEDRTNVVQYLQRKWFGGAKAPGRLVLDVAEGEAQTAGDVKLGGNLKLVKAGAGTYNAVKTQGYLGGNEIVGGDSVAGMASLSRPFGKREITVGEGGTFDINGYGAYNTYGAFELAGGTIVNRGAKFDGTGPLVTTKVSADSYFDIANAFGFYGTMVDLEGHTLDVTTHDTENGYFCIWNQMGNLNHSLRNGTLKVHGEGELKIWSSLDARTVDFDLDCPLWMCWTTTVHNLTFRYRNVAKWADEQDRGEFHVCGTFKPLTPYFHRTQMMDGSTLDLSGEAGTWSALGAHPRKLTVNAFADECFFEPNGTVTIDVHGRAFAVGERIITWPARPSNVTFVWDAATAAANPGVQPVADDQGLYFGFDAGTVSLARWTGAAGDGDVANPANWNCVNPQGEAVANGLPGAGTTVRFEGATALDLPVGTTFECAEIRASNVKLTRDCDWRGFTGRLTIEGALDLDGHRLYLETMPRGYPGAIASGYGFDPELAAPSTVSTEACFWLDASDNSTLTVDPDGRVSAWRSKGTVDVTAAPTNTNARPLWAPYDYGRPCVDFGATGSHLDLVYPRFTNLQTVFWVIKIEKVNTRCHLLGDWNEGNGTYNFHRGDQAQYGHATHSKFATMWNGTDVIDNWASVAIPDNDFQILSATMGQACCSDSLSQDRNFADRNGGRQLCELICFPRLLNNAERIEITQYLQQKWGGVHGANGVGELHLSVPEGQTYLNQEIALTGNLKLVKEGAGTFNAAYVGQKYNGGTEIAAGKATTVTTVSTSVTKYSGANARCYGMGSDIFIADGAELDFLGNYDYRVWKLTLDGGTLRNSDYTMQVNYGGLGEIDVTADSTFAFDRQTTFFTGGADNLINLNGHVLTIDMGAPFYPHTSVASNGTINLVGPGEFMATSPRDWSTVDLSVQAPMNMTADLDVRNYTAAYTGEVNAGGGAVRVHGVFKPVTGKFHGCVLMDGATLDLSAWEGTFSADSALASGNATMDCAPESAITVDIHGRTLAEGDQLVAWTTPPAGVTFAWDAASAEGADQVPVVRSDGLYYGGVEDQVVTDAVWIGEAGDGDISKPTNWTCRNAAGRVVEGGLPGAATTVHLSGTVKVDFPVGNAFTCQQLDLGGIKLADDCDWRGLTLPSDSRIDLDGHKLYLSDFPATGTVTCGIVGEGDNVGGEPSILSEACFWLDAAKRSSLTLDADGKVMRWESRDANHMVATPAGSGGAPTYSTALWGERPYVDFGAVGSNIDLGYNRFTNLRTVFWVVKIQKHEGAFLLGDMTSYHFHRGAQGQYASTGWGNFATIWNGTTAVNIGSDAIPDNGFQFLSATMKSDSASNRICTDRDCKTGGLTRTGGKQLSELVCFTRVLSDEERRTVTEYLQNKWLNGSQHRGELHLDVPAGKTVVNTGFIMEKSVRFVKDGAGSYVANCANLSYSGGNEVTGGAVRPLQTGTKNVFGAWDREMVLREGALFEQNGMNEYTGIRFVLDGGTIRNTGMDLQDATALGKVTLTADSRIEAEWTLSVWWDAHYLDMGGHTLTVTIGGGKYFTVGANTTALRNGTLDILRGGWLRIYHGALDASTVTLRAGCAIQILDDSSMTVKDYLACYNWNANNGNGIIKVLGTFMPAAGGYFHGCELQNGATLDLSEQTGVFNVDGTFSVGAKRMTFAADATTINVRLAGRTLAGQSKVVDWTGRAPENLAEMTFNLDAESRRKGRRLIVKDDGLYVESGGVIFLR